MLELTRQSNSIVRYVPNLLTTIRVILTCIFIKLLIDYFNSYQNDKYYIILLVFIIISLTDFFDGVIARAVNAASRAGAVYDLFADLLFIVSATLYIYSVGLLPLAYVLLVVAKFIEFNLTSYILRVYETEKRNVFVFDVLGRIAAVSFYVMPISICTIRMYFPMLLSDLILVQVFLLFLLSIVSTVSRCVRCYQCMSSKKAASENSSQSL